MDETTALRNLIKVKIDITGLTKEDVAFLLERSREILDRRETAHGDRKD